MDGCETSVLQRAQAGDKEAFGRIAERYYAAMLGAARAYSKNGFDADDAVQNALLLANMHLGQLKDPAKLSSRLRRLTVNACYQQTRATKATVPLESLPESGRDETEATDTRLLVEQALRCLSRETRLTVTLYYQRELSLGEIAAFQEVPMTTIKSRLRNARARLRKELETILEETILKTTTADRGADRAPRLLRRLESVQEIGYTVFSPDGTRFVTVAWLEITETAFTSVIACWQSETGEPLWSHIHTSWVFCPQFLPDGSHLAVSAGLPGLRGGQTGLVLLLDSDTGAVVRTISDVPAAKSLAVLPGGDVIALGGSEHYEDYRSDGQRGVAAIYDLATGQERLHITPHLNYVTALTFSPDGDTLATSSHLRDADPEAKDLWRGGDIRLWDAKSGALRQKLDRDDRGTRHNIVFSPDGSHLAAPNGGKGEIRLWDTTTGAIVRTLSGNDVQESVFVVAFSPNGATLAGGCGDNAVRLWDVATGALKRTMADFSHCIYALAFSPDGSRLVTADKNGVVQIWAL